MYTEDAAFDDRSDAQVVENLSTILPRVSVSVFAHYLVVETIYSGDLSSFMVASEKSN